MLPFHMQLLDGLSSDQTTMKMELTNELSNDLEQQLAAVEQENQARQLSARQTKENTTSDPTAPLDSISPLDSTAAPNSWEPDVHPMGANGAPSGFNELEANLAAIEKESNSRGQLPLGNMLL